MTRYVQHPLRGRCGTGPPLAPPGWRWRAGARIKDMYFYSPNGNIFRSKLKLVEYLDSHPGSPPIDEFRWHIGEHEFRASELPGTPGPIRGKEICALNTNDHEFRPLPLRKVKVKPRSKVYVKKSVARKKRKRPRHEDEESPSSGLDAEVETVKNKVQKTKTRKKPRLEEFSEAEAEVPTSKRKIEWILAGRDFSSIPMDVMKAKLDELSVEKFQEVQDRLNAILEEGRIHEYPTATLQVFYYLLRGEEAPASLDHDQLAKLCSTWVCKHKQAACLLEVDRLASMVDNSRGFGTKENCKRKTCCQKPEFCPGCNCTMCERFIPGTSKWEYFRCPRCLHLCHVKCSLTGIVFTGGNLLCLSCYHKFDPEIVAFCKDRVRDASQVSDMWEVETHLTAVVKVIGGISRSGYTQVQEELKVILSGADFQAAVNRLQNIPDCHLVLSGALQVEQVLSIRSAIVSEEARDAELKGKAETEYVNWLKADQQVEAIRSKIKEMEKQLGILEEGANKKAISAGEAKLACKESKKKLDDLKKLAQAEGMVELRNDDKKEETRRLSDSIDLLGHNHKTIVEPVQNKMERFVKLHQLLKC